MIRIGSKIRLIFIFSLLGPALLFLFNNCAPGFNTTVPVDSPAPSTWTNQLVAIGPVSTQSNAIMVDGNDNYFIAGSTAGVIGESKTHASSDVFITKFNSAGVKQWSRQLGAVDGYTDTRTIVKDSLENVIVVGGTQGSLDGNIKVSGFTQSEIFVTKYDPSGTKLWTSQLGVPISGSVNVYSAAVDSANNIFVTGSTNGSLDGNTLVGTNDLFVTKFNSSGVKQWTRQMGIAAKSTIATGVGVDSVDNIYVAGFTNGNLDGNTLTGTYDAFLVKYNSAGVKQWTQQAGVAAKTIQVNDLKIDGSDGIYLTGATSGGFGGNTQAGTFDMFLVKYDTSGTVS